jgi:hypothetical protein
MAIKVKTSLNKKGYVNRHIEQAEFVRRYPPAEIAINGKRVTGRWPEEVVTPAGFTPKAWCSAAPTPKNINSKTVTHVSSMGIMLTTWGAWVQAGAEANSGVPQSPVFGVAENAPK